MGECGDGEELNSHLANTSVVFSFSRGWGFNDIGTLLMEYLCFAIRMTVLDRCANIGQASCNINVKVLHAFIRYTLHAHHVMYRISASIKVSDF